MAITLGANQYGKAETRLVTVRRDGETHHMTDLNVSIALRGDLGASHLVGDNSHVVPTDTQKNTVFAFAKQAPVGEIEDFALRLGRHFVGSFGYITGARVLIDSYGWTRIPVDGQPHPHSFFRTSDEKRTTAVTVQDDKAWVVSGLRDLIVLKSTGSEFHGYPKDRYTTLPETTDRILATAVTARWRFAHLDVDWAKSFDVGPRRRCWRRSPTSTASRCSRPCTRWARRCWQTHPDIARGAAVAAEQAPLHGRPRARSSWPTTTRCSSRPTGPTA